MRPIILDKTAKTPEVNFDNKTGVLVIKGNSIPENSYELYQPLVDWVSKYIELPKPYTDVTIFLEYFNTTSSKYLYELLKKFELIEANVKVRWYYISDDEDMLMAGEEYQSMLNVDFELISVAPTDC